MKNCYIVVKALNESGGTAEQLFKCAFEYYEMRVSKKYIINCFLDYLHKDKVPQVVEDYCLEILAHRIHEVPQQ